MNGKLSADMNTGDTDTQSGIADNNFDSTETAVILDGTVLTTYKGVGTWLKNRELLAVTQ
jgi:hypothetical protein